MRYRLNSGGKIQSKKRRNRPGYYLGVDKLGRKTWKLISGHKKVPKNEIKQGDIVKINDKNNGVVEDSTKDAIVVTNHKTNKSKLLKGPEKYDAIQQDNENEIKEDIIESGKINRVSGTDMSPKQIAESYDSLSYKIGETLESEDNKTFKVVGTSQTNAILADPKGILFSTPQNSKKLKVVEEVDEFDSEDTLREAVGNYRQFLKNKIPYSRDREFYGGRRESSGAVVFVKDIKSIISLLTGISFETNKPKGIFGTIPSLRGKFL